MAKYSGKRTRFSKTGIYKSKKKKRPDIGSRLYGLFNTIISRFREWKTELKSIERKKITKVRKTKIYRFEINSFPDTISRINSFLRSIISKLRESKTAIIGIISGLLLAFIVILIIDFYKVKSLANFQPNITTKIYDKNGILISELFTHKREVVPIKKIPEDLIHAFISIEDNEFYDHFGVNPKGIIRAFFINIFSGRIKQGGSTITQQLSKILLTSRKRSIYRKIKEAFIAIMMEFNYSKDEIMSLYLNQIFLGHGTYGVESASMLYFDKHVWELNLAECAIIATLPSAPNRLTPIRHPKRSMQRHKTVLAKMVEMGYISVREAERAYLDFWPSYREYLDEISPTMTTVSLRTNKAPWFTEYIRRKLVKKYGKETVYEKGLLVYTTLDIKKQLAAQNILKKRLDIQTTSSARLAFKNDDYIVDNYSDMIGLFSTLFDIPSFRKRGSRQNEKINRFFRNKIVEELEGINYIAGIDSIGKFLDEYKDTYFEDKDLQKVEGCLISINHNNGYIEAMVGGSEFSSINQLNRTMQARRQPGSAIKPLLYSAAIESGEFSPATTVLDSPVVYLDNEGGDWLPENYEGEYYGFVRLRRALILSINVVSIRIADKLGIKYVMKYLAKLLKFDKATAKKRIPRNFSIALGSMEVSPFELTRAYSIIANGGKDVIPFSIRYIKDREGNILENREEEISKILSNEAKDGSMQIIKPDTAQVMISMMRSVISSGTGRSASPGRPAAGKTGTTNNWKDAWFVGYTPQITTGIWVGYDKMGLSLGIGQAGGAVSAPIWGEYMREAMRHEPILDFPRYAGLARTCVCKKSGLLPSPDCRHTIDEIFTGGTLPEKRCDICSGIVGYLDVAKIGPRENISKEQKRSIISNINRERGDTTIDDLEGDLLE